MAKGVLRVGGRLSQSAMPEEVKHPAILPKGKSCVSTDSSSHPRVSRPWLEESHAAPGFASVTGYCEPTLQQGQS